MRKPPGHLLIAGVVFAGLVLIGCTKKHEAAGHSAKSENADHDHDRDHHHHEDEAETGASFKPGKGVILPDETRKSLGVQTAEVVKQNIPIQLRFTAQVFGEDHRHTAIETHHAECSAKAAGLISHDKAREFRPGQTITASRATESFGGVILGVNKGLALGDAEVLVGITNSGALLKPGDFLSIALTIPREESVVVIPKSALLRTAEGTFAYTQNGAAFLRTTIRTGTEGEDLLEITDGLRPGDVVVLAPVEKLWLIELRSTKGGGHSH